jgi:hypothetical protein
MLAAAIAAGTGRQRSQQIDLGKEFDVIAEKTPDFPDYNNDPPGHFPGNPGASG